MPSHSSGPTSELQRPFLGLLAPDSQSAAKPTVRLGPRRKAHTRDEYDSVPNNSDGEYQDIMPMQPMKPASKSKDTNEVILAAQRKNPMRKDDKDGPSDPNAMYWDSK